MTDTADELEASLIEECRRMSPAEKFRRVEDLTEAAMQLVAQEITKRQGVLSERELRLRVASRWLDAELMRKAFGWDPRAHAP